MPGNSLDDVLPDVVKNVRAASALAAQDVDFYRSLDTQLALAIDNAGRNILSLTNKMIEASASSVEDAETIEFGKENLSWKPIGDVLDSLYERVDMAFDRAQPNQKKDNNQFTYLEDGTKDSMAPSKAITKPQLEFRVKIDNSESHPFKPRITTKPNAIVPYETSMTLVPADEDGEVPLHYRHPYECEIDKQAYPDSVLQIHDPISPTPWAETSAIWVDTIPKLEAMVEQLRKLTEIAVDLEHHDYRTYYGLVCLMQISNREQDWIVDTLKLRDDLEPLNIVFTDPDIIKLFHGAFMDIIWLQRDLGLYVVSLFDTYHASKKLGFPKFSLAYLLETFANFKTSKKYQLADWRTRPLLPAMISYARSDTHFLLYIYDQLRNKLIEKGDGRMQEVLYESRQVAKRRFEYTRFRPLNAGSNVVAPVMSSDPREPYGNLMAQYRVSHHKLPLIKALYEWRDELAKKEDESTRFIMPNQLLVALSMLLLPVDSQKVLSASNYISDAVRVNAEKIAKLIECTLKEMDENDWDLVDRLSNSMGNDTAFVNSEQPDVSTIQITTKVFEKMSNDILQNGENSELLSDKSVLLSDVLDKDKEQFSVEYDINAKKVIKHYTTETQARVERVQRHLDAINDLETFNVVIPEDSTVDNTANEVAAEPEVASEPDISAPQNDIPTFASSQKDSDLITLRKKRQPNSAGKELHDNFPSQPSFDYANADKIMIDTNKKKSRKDANKKRSFDPYASTGDGPKAAKKSKRVNSGKTSTFSNRKK